MDASRYRLSTVLVVFFVCAMEPMHVVANDPVTAEQVRESIDRGVQFLRRMRQSGNGTWPEYPGQPGGVTALCTLALISAGYDTNDIDVAAGLQQLRRLGNPEKTYATSLQTMVFCSAEPSRDQLLIRRNVQWLEQAQETSGPYSGGWTYDANPGIPDESNSQFALLALHEAALAGAPVRPEIWQRAAHFWESRQHANGAWDYRGQNVSGSMTCAGISSVIITNHHLSFGDASVRNGRVSCCGTQPEHEPLQRGISWLARNFSVSRNPGDSPNARSANLDYYLYGLERVGRLSGQRFIGRHDWYREGAEFLVSRQDRLTGSWVLNQSYPGNSGRSITTSMALLFLAKGKRPIVASKLQFVDGIDWNRHRHDLANLCQFVERRWEMPLGWQTIDLRAASVEDLLQSPVLYLSGRDGLRLSAAQKRSLLDYLNRGGFLFAEASCEGEAFDRDFRQLMTELFPDNPMRLLPADHPIWYAEEVIPPEFARPLYGVDSCCRTSVVYCPRDLGCYWDLSRGNVQVYPPDIQLEIRAVLGIGANVLAYATGRELRDKLDVPLLPIAQVPSDPVLRGNLAVAKLQHGGGSDDAPAALSNLLTVMAQQVQIPVQTRRTVLSPTARELPDYPIAFMQGRSSFTWTDEERMAIAQFIENGGVLIADAICGSEAFAKAFRREMELTFPDHPMKRIAPDHPMFTNEFRGFDIRQVKLRRPRARQEGDPVRSQVEATAPRLEGIEWDGSFSVIFSPYDLSCALENHASLECLGYERQDAARIGINLLLYALQQ